MLNPYASRISGFVLKTQVAFWLSFAGSEHKSQQDDSDAVGYHGADLIGESLQSEFLTADEGFYAGVNFALSVASHVLTDPFGDPSLLIRADVVETREWLTVIAKDAEDRYKADHRKKVDKDTELPTAARALPPPLELLERRHAGVGCAA